MKSKLFLTIALAVGLLTLTAALVLSQAAPPPAGAALSLAAGVSSSDVDETTGAGDDFMVSLPLDHQADPSVAYNPDDDQYLV
ncbi:MAG: hypothetical protein U9R15_10985, partial [Chloroflexota bacterium]|nr:hypothetical protein [Chloroflexota bacterium]